MKKLWSVSGYCLCPAEAHVVVEADSEAEAVSRAQVAFKNLRKSPIMIEHPDTDAAYDWFPTAEPFSEDQKRPSPWAILAKA